MYFKLLIISIKLRKWKVIWLVGTSSFNFCLITLIHKIIWNYCNNQNKLLLNKFILKLQRLVYIWEPLLWWVGKDRNNKNLPGLLHEISHCLLFTKSCVIFKIITIIVKIIVGVWLLCSLRKICPWLYEVYEIEDYDLNIFHEG